MSARDENLFDQILFYSGVVLAILGMAGAGIAVVRAMLLKGWVSLAQILGS